jgi:predicted GNAT superfamily acetyltransferase
VAGSQAVIEIRQLFQLADFEEVLHLQQAIWGFPDIELLPLRFLVVVNSVGGHVFGAYDGDMMVGFCFAIPGVKRGGQPYLHSHMLGVLPAYRDAHVGRSLKLKQREEALARGIQLIEWTFDPLELKNAFFNIERLGAIVRRYHENQYGITFSPLHGGLPTDRCYAEWWIASPRVEAILGRPATSPPAPMVRPSEAISRTSDTETAVGRPATSPPDPLARPSQAIGHPSDIEAAVGRTPPSAPAPLVRPYEAITHPSDIEAAVGRTPTSPPDPMARPSQAIAYPADIARIRTEDPRRARQIQKENGEKFRHAFEQGLAVTRFERGDRESSYLLEPWK